MQLVFICGGRGRRLGALNPGLAPKAMLPIAGAPIVEHLWRRFAPLSDAPPIFVHAASDPNLPAWTSAVVPDAILCPQAAPDGVANAFRLAAPHLRGPALFVLGDVVLAGAFAQPLPPPPAVGIWIAGSDRATRANFGVRLEGSIVSELVEKPTTIDGLVTGIGAYLLAPEHLSDFASSPVNPRTNEREITEALRHLTRAGHTLRALPFDGTYLNVNEPGDVTTAEGLLR